MTFRPSKTATGFCSPSSTRNWKRSPFCSSFANSSPKYRNCGRAMLPPCSDAAVGKQQDLRRVAALQARHRAGEFGQRQAVGEERIELQLALAPERQHLMPGLEHAAAVNALHHQTLE